MADGVTNMNTSINPKLATQIREGAGAERSKPLPSQTSISEAAKQQAPKLAGHVAPDAGEVEVIEATAYTVDDGPQLAAKPDSDAAWDAASPNVVILPEQITA